MRRVNQVAGVHGASDGVTLLAASSKLTKSAKTWYEVQTGAAVESWIGLRAEMLKIFERKVPFYKAVQRAELRKWVPAKETFDEYAIAKLALIHQLDLPMRDSIHLLISGIANNAIRASALLVADSSLEDFLETEGCADLYEKKTVLTKLKIIRVGIVVRRATTTKNAEKKLPAFTAKRRGIGRMTASW